MKPLASGPGEISAEMPPCFAPFLARHALGQIVRFHIFQQHNRSCDCCTHNHPEGCCPPGRKGSMPFGPTQADAQLRLASPNGRFESEFPSLENSPCETFSPPHNRVLHIFSHPKATPCVPSPPAPTELSNACWSATATACEMA